MSETASDLLAQREELEDELEEIDTRRSAIKSQLDAARATRHTSGEYADPHWYRRANDALRILGVDRNAAARNLGDVNRRLREQRHSESQVSFGRAVRDVVDPQTWALIIARQEEILAEAGESR